MIKNQKQATIVKTELSNLRDLIEEMEKLSRESNLNLKQQVQLDIFKSRVEEFNSELKEYETYTSKNLDILEMKNESLQNALIGFRIASGLTQKELAEKLELKEQQIQRYELNNYLTASFERIIQIIEALEVEVNLKKQFRPKSNIIDYNKFLIPSDKKETIKKSVEVVAERKQLVNWQ